ncbi:MAG: EAL domain-containing protein [Mycobacterium sp.]|nr:EAL domain-containing protein [Mycobacterium sp.]
MTRTTRAAVASAFVFAAFLAWVLSGASQSALTEIYDIVTTFLAMTAAASMAWAAKAARGRLRASWGTLSLGFAAWAIGEIIWSVYELTGRQPPVPSPADVGYLLLPVCVCAGLLLFPAGRNAGARARVLIDGVIVAASLFLVSWITILEPLYHAPDANPLGFVVSIAYPLTDVLVLTICAVVLVRASVEQRFVLTLLALGLTCMALADSGFAYLTVKNQYATGAISDIGWVSGLLIVTVAAVAGRDASAAEDGTPELPGWAAIVLPYAPLLLAAVVVAAQPLDHVFTGPVESTAAILVIAVLARQFVAVRENRKLLLAVAEQALHDPLTGLANRALFNMRLADAMEADTRHNNAVGVIALDLNDFKMVNDSLGHPVGDDLLVGVADRLMKSVRPDDTVARVGGDEFSVVLVGNPDAAHLVANRLAEAFEAPFVLRGHELSIRPSLGLAIAGHDESDLSAEDLIRRADTAMYAAKRSRARGVVTYNPDMHLATGAVDVEPNGPASVPAGVSGVAAIELLADLRQAVADGELALVYQPKVDLITSRIVGVEALLRWPRRSGEVLSPDDFLPLVRRHGLMVSVTEFVLNRALDDVKVWHAAPLDLSVAVNLFAPSLANLGVPDTIIRALADRGLDPSALTVEITEDMFLDDVQRTRTVLEQLRRGGVRIAIDDFGSGYSALSYLRDLPIDEVKLDRQFIGPILTDQRAATVALAVIDLARGLGLTAVAEGIEDAGTAAWLRDHGCPVGQGYFLSPPLSSLQLLSLLGQPAGGTGLSLTRQL